MKIRALGFAVIVGSVSLCLGVPAFAQEVSVQYTGGYSTTWSNTEGDFGAGIYTGNINGAPSASGIICDDFKDEITSGETWNANAYQASSLASGNLNNTLFGSAIGLPGYAEVATLVSMQFSGASTYGGITGLTQSEIASAIWDITAGNTLSGLDTKAKLLVWQVELAFNGNIGAATKYLAGLTNLWILTPNPLGPNEPQEMWTRGLAVPEGGAGFMFLLLAGISCFGAMYLRSRTQLKTSQLA
jgi:hypothetical protein